MLMTNRNKRSITIDLKAPSGAEIASRLTAAADVLVENFSAGVMDRLGLGYADLAAINPRIVYASMSAYGHTGPHRGWTGMNVTLQACSGLMMATGQEGDPPIGISNSWNDYVGGLHAATAIVGALGKRSETGRGQHLDVSQFECSVAMIGSLLLASAVEKASPMRRGSRSSLAAPQGCYRCAGKDQWCAISVRDDEQWRALAPELGDLVHRYPTLADRQAHHDEIDAAIEAWTKTLAPKEVEQRLLNRGIAAAAMRRGNDIADVEEWRGVLRPIEGLGEPGTRVIGLPFSFRGARPVEAAAPPHLGEHGREVLRDWLGLDEEVAA
jgi:crotonobetainyl-CoA:carnitine CoA-transferase CaiB-like acyl-CoA transferase